LPPGAYMGGFMALITLTDYEAHSNKQLPENTNQIENAILAASSYVEKRLGFDLSVNASPIHETWQFSGNGKYKIFTKKAPVTDVESISYWNGSLWYNVDDLNYNWTYKDSGKIWFTDGNKFHKGDDNWKIVYQWGYTELPSDLTEAACILTDHFLQLAKHPGIKDQADGEQSFTYDRKIPDIANQIIARYKRY